MNVMVDHILDAYTSSLKSFSLSGNTFVFPAEVFEEVLEIVSYMTFFSPTISLDMWSLWPLMMEALADWAIDFFPSMFLHNDY